MTSIKSQHRFSSPRIPKMVWWIHIIITSVTTECPRLCWIIFVTKKKIIDSIFMRQIALHPRKSPCPNQKLVACARSCRELTLSRRRRFTIIRTSHTLASIAVRNRTIIVMRRSSRIFKTRTLSVPTKMIRKIIMGWRNQKNKTTSSKMLWSKHLKDLGALNRGTGAMPAQRVTRAGTATCFNWASLRSRFYIMAWFPRVGPKRPSRNFLRSPTILRTTTTWAHSAKTMTTPARAPPSIRCLDPSIVWERKQAAHHMFTPSQMIRTRNLCWTKFQIIAQLIQITKWGTRLQVHLVGW